MLNVTKPALDRLSNRLTDRSGAADVALRFTQRTGRWRLAPDHERPGDVAFERDGRKVLLLDPATAESMARLTLGVRTTDAGSRLRLRRARPKVQ